MTEAKQSQISRRAQNLEVNIIYLQNFILSKGRLTSNDLKFKSTFQGNKIAAGATSVHPELDS